MFLRFRKRKHKKRKDKPRGDGVRYSKNTEPRIYNLKLQHPWDILWEEFRATPHDIVIESKIGGWVSLYRPTEEEELKMEESFVKFVKQLEEEDGL